MADQLRQTPEPLPSTDFNEGSNISSPLKPLGLPVAGHNAEELAQRTIPRVMRETSIEEMWYLLDHKKEDVDTEFSRLPSMDTAEKAVEKMRASRRRKISPEFVYTVYLNMISDAIHNQLVQKLKKIHFYDRHSYAPEDHATGTINRPDFLACQVRGETVPKKFYWSALEATGELLSGKNRENSHIKTVSYTSYLLQARPDRLTVQGINVEEKGFRLIVSNACGASSTEQLDWGSRDSRLLLCAWILRLYQPVVDPSITVNIEGDERPTFNITLPENEVVYKNCKILSVGSGFGRRTIVLRCPEKPYKIIKEQYIEKSRRFQEGPILTLIHQRGKFPGVVRLDWHTPAEAAIGAATATATGAGAGAVAGQEQLVVDWQDPKTGKISTRTKTRMVLLDEGRPIMDTKTLREALVAIYDVLEITRFLHTKREILHRDISPYNVLLAVVPANTSSAGNDPLPDVVPVNTSSTGNTPLPNAVPMNTSSTDNALLPNAVPASTPFAEDLHDMYFGSYLLRTKSEDQSVGRLDTNVLLIDFDMAEAQNYNNPGKKGPHSRTGTPIFMARAVDSARKESGEYRLAAMPQLKNQTTEIYKAAVPTRLTAFPANEREDTVLPENKPLLPFKHKLEYDAESVFWLLLWWAIRALPVDDTLPGSKSIHHGLWTNLTGGDDERDLRTYYIPKFPKDVVHPAYGPLQTLLEQMAKQLEGYHDEGEDLSRKKDEYLHEAFQRLIFQFLFTHYDESFMTTEKSPEPRKPANQTAMEAPLAAGQINKARARTSATSGQEESSSSRILRSGPKRKSGETSTDEDQGDRDWNPRGKRHKGFP